MTYFQLSVAIVCALWGAVFLVAPRAITRIEETLNRAWGNHCVFSLRVGVPGERAAEQWLNRPVEARRVHWDGWVREHPRMLGLTLCSLAGVLTWCAMRG